MGVGNNANNTYSICTSIQFVLVGDSSLLRLMADSFGMTTTIGLIWRVSSGDSLSESPLLTHMPPKYCHSEPKPRAKRRGKRGIS